MDEVGGTGGVQGLNPPRGIGFPNMFSFFEHVATTATHGILAVIGCEVGLLHGGLTVMALVGCVSTLVAGQAMLAGDIAVSGDGRGMTLLCGSDSLLVPSGSLTAVWAGPMIFFVLVVLCRK